MPQQCSHDGSQDSDRRRALSEVEAAGREQEAFLHAISHDLRAPLRVIQGFSQILIEDYSDRLDDQGSDYLKRLQAAGQRMGKVLDDLLQLSRVIRGDLVPQDVDLRELAREVADQLTQAAPGREVSFRVAPDLRACGDRRLLMVVLRNLLENAWKFTAGKEHAVIELGVRQSPGELRAFFVRDNGVGFDMAYAENLFVPSSGCTATPSSRAAALA